MLLSTPIGQSPARWAQLLAAFGLGDLELALGCVILGQGRVAEAAEPLTGKPLELPQSLLARGRKMFGPDVPRPPPLMSASYWPGIWRGDWLGGHPQGTPSPHEDDAPSFLDPGDSSVAATATSAAARRQRRPFCPLQEELGPPPSLHSITVARYPLGPGVRQVPPAAVPCSRLSLWPVALRPASSPGPSLGPICSSAPPAPSMSPPQP